MFGREAERARIERMLDCAGSAPVGLALEGVPGIGKTTLWREGLDSARERAYRVLVTAPAEPDAALGFAGLGDLFEGILDELGSRLPHPQRDALAAALAAAPAPEEPTDPMVLRRAVLTVVRQLSAADWLW